jgi:hypothetical protein
MKVGQETIAVKSALAICFEKPTVEQKALKEK